MEGKLVSFGLTHVMYIKGDIIGYFLALLSLSPIFIMVMYATLIVFRRDFQTIFIVFGQLLNVAVNLILKKVISQPRPHGR
jgi:dolichyldiphosphatase